MGNRQSIIFITVCFISSIGWTRVSTGGVGNCQEAADPVVSILGLSENAPRPPAGGIVQASQFTIEVCKNAKSVETNQCDQKVQALKNQIADIKMEEGSIHAAAGSVSSALESLGTQISEQRTKCDNEFEEAAKDCSKARQATITAVTKFETKLQGEACDSMDKLGTAKKNLASAEEHASSAKEAYESDAKNINQALTETNQTQQEVRSLANDTQADTEMAAAGRCSIPSSGGSSRLGDLTNPNLGSSSTCMTGPNAGKIFVGPADVIMSICQASCY